jgi:MFS family permease
MSLAAVTAVAMGVATFVQTVFGVIASDLISEFGIARWQIGALVTACGLTGAALSPFLGRVTDRVGGVGSVRGVMLSSGLAILVVAIAPTYALVFIGAMLGGVPNGWTNPATNSLIVENTELGSRGVITGVKQSGVQAGTFLGGLLLPTLSDAFDWRVAFACFLVFPLVGWLGMLQRPSARRSRLRDEEGTGSLPTA